MTMSRLARIEAIEDLLGHWGFTPSHIKREFPLNVTIRHSIRADIIAFNDATLYDTSTSAVVAHTGIDSEDSFLDLQRAAANVGAPVVLVGSSDRDTLAIWSTAANPRNAVKVDEAAYSNFEHLYSRVDELGIDSIDRVKGRGAQSALFPMDVRLLDFARKTSRAHLTESVEYLVAHAASELAGTDSTLITRMAIGAIAVVMLRDKGLVDSTLTGGALLDAATNRFQGYLDWVNRLDPRLHSIFDTMVADLEQSLSFAGLEPYMVSDVYEEALVTHSQRRNQGTFYTPPPLARQMMKAVPLEAIHPDRRHVLDPACGSGTMLIAAANRLREAWKPRNGQRDLVGTHQYVTGHLRGFDKDYFATEITKLALLLAALPIGNSWHVDAADILRVHPGRVGGPSIVISNPPWQNSRREGPRIETANRFVSWMLTALADDGYLACVLPLSWLDAVSNRGARTEFLAKVELLDLWRLPTDVFPQISDAIAPIVVIAHKRSTLHRRPTVVKTVTTPHSLQRFYEEGRAASVHVTDPGATGEGLLTGQVSRYLSGPEFAGARIADIAVVRNGRPHLPGRSARSIAESTHLEVSSLDDLLSFGQAKARVPVRFPEDFSKTSRKWHEYIDSEKIILSAKRWSNRDPWRFKVGYDLKRFIPRESFHAVIPISDSPHWLGLPQKQHLPTLLAILGSGLANCWVDDRTPGRNLSPRAFDSMPIPTSLTALEALAEIGTQLIEAAGTPDIEQVARDLERRMADLYRLPDSVKNAIASRLGDQIAPEGGIRYELDEEDFPDTDPAHPSVSSFGEVLAVDDERGLRVWISGVTDDEGQWLGIPETANGWLYSKGMDFIIKGQPGDLAGSVFLLHESEWELPSDVGAQE